MPGAAPFGKVEGKYTTFSPIRTVKNGVGAEKEERDGTDEPGTG
jgi:hypothetical protein